MGEFFEIGSQLTKNLVEGFATFWAWFTSPLFKGLDLSWLNPEWGNLSIAPWMVLSFFTLIVIFTASLIHLLNPLN